MDAYNKVLVRIFEITGGKETAEVDLVELTKAEGFFPSLEEIKGHLCRESWLTETSTKNVVRMTHWGVSAAKKAKSQEPGGSRIIEREANELHAESRQLGVIIEEFRANPTHEKLKAVEDKFTQLQAKTAKIKALL